MTFERHQRGLPVYLFFVGFFAVGLANGLYRRAAFEHSPTLYWALDVAHFVILPVVLSVALRRCGWSASQFGVNLHADGVDWFDSIIASVLLFMLLLAAYQGFTNLGSMFVGSTGSAYYFAPEVTGQPAKALSAVYKSVSAGVWEEFVYKGLLTPVLLRSKHSPLKVLGLAVFSATTFSAIHWENGEAELIGTWCFGFIGFLLYTRFLDLAPFILAHTAIDLYHFW